MAFTMSFKLSVSLTLALVSFSYEAFIGDIYVKDDDSSILLSNPGVALADGGRLSNPDLLWPGGRVYYKFDPTFRGKKGQDLVLKIMRYIEAQFKLPSSEEACILFEKLDESSETRQDYVLITGDGGGVASGVDCFSQLGRQSGEQILNLGTSCLTPALVLHELLHTLGFDHEMNRSDRDDFLVVDYDNILDNKKHNYVKRTNTKADDFVAKYPSDVDSGLTPFDISSVLMYPPAITVVHTKNGKPAIEYRTPPIMSWPNPKTEDLLSAIDKVEMATAYECEIDQTLMVDYIHLNRLSTVSRLQNVTQQKIKNDDENNDQCQVLSEEMKEMREFKDSLEKDFKEAKATISKQGDQIIKQEDQNSKQEDQISKLEEKNNKQEDQIGQLEEKNRKQEDQIGEQEDQISKLEEKNTKHDKQLNNMEQSLQDLISRVENPCTADPCGPNSECRNVGGVATCSCLHSGSPPRCGPNDAQCLEPYSTLSDSWRKAVYTPAGAQPCNEHCDKDMRPGWFRFVEPAGVSLPIKPPAQDPDYKGCTVCQTLASAWIKERRHPARGEGIINITFCYALGTNTCYWETTGKTVTCDGFVLYYLTNDNNCPTAFCALG